jgi:hypothetical protein
VTHVKCGVSLDEVREAYRLIMSRVGSEGVNLNGLRSHVDQ